jgi:hypothetical protein
MPAPQQSLYELKDEVSCATPHGMLYGTVIRIVSPGSNGAVEVEYEDGRREIRKVTDRSMKVLKRANEPQREQRREDVDDVRRSEIRRFRH